MTVSKVQETEERIVERTEWVKCDLCGETDKEASEYHADVRWENDDDTHRITAVYLKEYSVWPGDPEVGEIIGFHICPKCFKEKFIPWMKSNGATPTETEY